MKYSPQMLRIFKNHWFQIYSPDTLVLIDLKLDFVNTGLI